MKSLTRPAGRTRMSVELKPRAIGAQTRERATAQCCAKVAPTVAGCHD